MAEWLAHVTRTITLTIEADSIAEAREAAFRSAWSWQPESAPDGQGSVAVAMTPDGCGECDDGLLEVGGCTCGGGGPDGIPLHGPYCGTEPCPNGCWDRLHPSAPSAGEVRS